MTYLQKPNNIITTMWKPTKNIIQNSLLKDTNRDKN